jgi:hypothetical protein
MTLGNALRRVLLSSLQGAAVTAVQIDGVLHEFSSIPGVREDVTDIVLNIKEIALKMHGDGPKRMMLRKQGPGEVTAGDIETGPGDIEILNPDHVICTSTRAPRSAWSSRSHRQGLCPGRPQPSGRRADRPDPGRLDLLAGQEGLLQGRRTPAKARCSTTTS